ncbi:MAG: hypothetical protein COB17_03400 [Sulfurimonas sp.]|nr:MAG: hypothetical protein COB17_03400 [Sulfurimonas sp.]
MKMLHSHEYAGQKMSLHVKKAESDIDRCELYQKKELALIGISLGNSYFNEKRLKLIISGFAKNFKKVAILLADDLAMHNYLAVGYSESKARKKIKKNSNFATNRINKIIEDLGDGYDVKFYKWKDIESFSKFKDSLKLIETIYESDNEFSKEINNLTLKVIRSYTSNELNEIEVINEAKWYLLKELAFADCASDFFNSSLLTCYYTDISIYRKILNNEFKGLDKQINHDYLIYECREVS